MYKDKDHPIEKRWQIGEFFYRRCPTSTVSRETWFWIKAYNLYKNGVLPNVGGWLDQTNKYNDVMTFIDTHIQKHQREQNG